MDNAIRTAWCLRCDGPQECDERGCIVCQVMGEKIRISKASSAVRRRARLTGKGLCINGITHGSPVQGRTKCARCVEVHRRSA